MNQFEILRTARRSISPRCLAASAAMFVLVAPSAFGADRAALAQAQKLYQQERAACLEGRTGQDRETCLKEAVAALKEASSTRTEDAAQLERNRLRRCDDLSATEQAACLRTMSGEGEVRGSVQGGGVVRQIVTIIPAPAASAPSN